MRLLSPGLILPTSEAEFFPEDDVDRLFKKLHRLEPPGDIVKQILTRIKGLPASPPLPQAESEQAPILIEKPQKAVE